MRLDRALSVKSHAQPPKWGRAERTLTFLLNNLQKSLADISAALELEPRHFGALSGRGLILVRLRQLEPALSAFEEALDISPQMAGPRANIKAIRKSLGQREI